MARGKASSVKNMPDALARGKDLYPVIPYRARLALTTDAAANNEKETIDFDLQFENNEVMDIFKIVINFDLEMDDITDGLNHIASFLAILEDPDKVVTTDISSESFYETDSSLVAWFVHTVLADHDTEGSALSKVSEMQVLELPQPYTVARNIAAIAQADWVEADVVVATISVELWGRRRIASDEEFKNIIYRQRF